LAEGAGVKDAAVPVPTTPVPRVLIRERVWWLAVPGLTVTVVVPDVMVTRSVWTTWVRVVVPSPLARVEVIMVVALLLALLRVEVVVMVVKEVTLALALPVVVLALPLPVVVVSLEAGGAPPSPAVADMASLSEVVVTVTVTSSGAVQDEFMLLGETGQYVCLVG
jgi:hypothetical protein